MLKLYFQENFGLFSLMKKSSRYLIIHNYTSAQNIKEQRKNKTGQKNIIKLCFNV